MQGGGVIRTGHIEHCVGSGEGPAQAGPGQCSGDTAASLRWVHENAAEVVVCRSSRARLLCCQLEDPAIGHYVAAGLGDEHLAPLTSDIRCELLPAVAGLYSKDTHGKLDRRYDVRLR